MTLLLQDSLRNNLDSLDGEDKKNALREFCVDIVRGSYPFNLKEEERIGLIEFLLKEGLDLGNESNIIISAMQSLSTTDFSKKVALIFKEKYPDILAAKDKKGQTAFMTAAQRLGSEEDLMFFYDLSRENPDFKSEQEFALRTLAKGFLHKSLVEKILKDGANPDAKDENGQTPLMIACREGRSEMVRILLEHGANPNLCDNEGKTALMYLEFSMKLDDEFGYHIHMERTNKDITEKFLKTEMVKELFKDPGIKVGNEDSRFRAAKKFFLKYHHQKIFEHLNSHGADFTLRDNDGNSALQLMHQEGLKELEALLVGVGISDYEIKEGNSTSESKVELSPNFILGQERFKNLSYTVGYSLQNIGQNKYPFAKLNGDGSVSFFVNVEEEKTKIESLQRDLEDPLTIRQLEYCAQRLGFKKADKTRAFFESQESEDVKEYRLNLSPEDLDSILKHNEIYRGYSLGHNLMKLRDNTNFDSRVIRLFPVFHSEDSAQISLIPMIAGCQFSETISVQILHLLPNYTAQDNKPFHWMAPKVTKDLTLSVEDVFSIVKKVCKSYGFAIVGTDGKEPKLSDKIEDLLLRRDVSSAFNPQSAISEMSEEAQTLYLRYALSTKEELANLLSFEVDSIRFLESLKEVLEEKKSHQVEEDIQKLSTAIGTVNLMIQTEEMKRGLDGGMVEYAHQKGPEVGSALTTEEEEKDSLKREDLIQEDDTFEIPPQPAAQNPEASNSGRWASTATEENFNLTKKEFLNKIQNSLAEEDSHIRKKYSLFKPSTSLEKIIALAIPEQSDRRLTSRLRDEIQITPEIVEKVKTALNEKFPNSPDGFNQISFASFREIFDERDRDNGGASRA